MAKKKKVIDRSNNPAEIQDITPVIQEVTPHNQLPSKLPAAIVPPVVNYAMNYQSHRYLGRGQFLHSEYNLREIGRVEDTDSYVRQAFGKKVALMFKEGWDLVGSNPKTIRYVRQRLTQIAAASRVPTLQLLRDIGSGLVRKSNVFILKVRNTKSSGGRVRTTPEGWTLDPVAGYFIVPAETMEYQILGQMIIRWRQRMVPGGIYQEFDPNNIIHMYFDRKEGFIFGTPTLVPVLDDIRALRKIEENIELLVYQHLFPIFQWKVGTPEAPAGVDEHGIPEVDTVRREIQFMPSEGGIVTTERHEINAIGAEGRALKADGYLTHFKNRVISGLGMSAVDYGEGDTANRATADNMSRNLIDSVKDFQQVIELFVNEFIINELLLESTFGDQVLEPENRVWLKFKEIDIDAQVKKDTHAADQFAKNMITFDEARVKTGYEPIPVPTPEEIQSGEDLQDKYPAWHKTFWKLFDEPKTLIQAIKEPYSLAAQGAIASPSTSLTPAHAQEATKQGNEAAMAEAKAKAASVPPKPAPKKVSDSILTNTYNNLQTDLAGYIKTVQLVDHAWIDKLVRAGLEPVIPKLQTEALISFRNGYAKHGNLRSDRFLNTIAFGRTVINSRVNRYIDRLTNDTVNSLKRNLKEDSPDLHLITHSVFDVLKYRTKFIEDVEVRKAYSYGMVLGMRDAGHSTVHLNVPGDECEACNSLPSIIDTSVSALDDVPPYHANCNCYLTKEIPVTKKITDSIQDNVDLTKAPPNDGKAEEAIMHANGDAAICPDCGKTAMRAGESTSFRCRACRKSFDKKNTKDSFNSNQYQFLECVFKARTLIFQKHPEWDDGQITAEAEQSCLSKLADYLKNDLLTVTDKLEFLKLETRVELRKKHPKWDEDKIRYTASAIATVKAKNRIINNE